MSNDQEELIDYEDEHDVVATNGAAAPANGKDAAAPAKTTGIHSTGFR
jgi:ATP-dependent RNA helicase UAP56/SUB2